MKTIINITLGGRSIAIEDSAYEKIKAYTESLGNYYRNEEGRDEIIADIESRLSELMHEKIRKGAVHITDAHVDEMIGMMGRPEDFDKEAKAEGGDSQNQSNPNFTFNEKRRLYRDESNKMIGGVCSGIANWLNIDPTVVRVLFAIISFGGLGSGFLIYIILWIVLPANNMSVYLGKRMYRNPDDKVIGGVAGGMGAYFNINPTTIRWILAIPLILSALKGVHFFGWDDDLNIFPNIVFGSLSGTFIFAYIVLWIVLPEANSPYQKMEMHGQTIDVNTIKDRVQSFGQEVKQTGERLGAQVNTFAQTRGPEFGREFGRAAAKGGKGVGYVIAMIFKAFFVFVAGTIAISLFVAFLAFLFSGFAWAPVNNFLWTNDNQQMWAWGTLLFFIGAPIVALVISLTRMILSIRTPGNYLNWLFGGLWTVGWVCLTMFISSISHDLKRVETIETPVSITQPVNGKLILKVTQPELEYSNRDYSWVNYGNNLDGFNMTPDTLKLSTVNVNFEKSPDGLYHVIVRKEALGRTDEEAMNRVKLIQYNITSVDSVLDLPNGFAISKNQKYRFQNVKVMVQVPVGKSIVVDPTVKEKLSAADFNFRKTDFKSTVTWKKHDMLRQYRSNIVYTMNENGTLVSADEKENITTVADSAYRWNDGTDTVLRPAAPAAPIAPTVVTDTANIYRYDVSPSTAVPATEKTKEQLRKELELKQKELEELKKKLGQ